MVGHLQAAASPGFGCGAVPRRVHAGRLLGVGWLFARAREPARADALVLPLCRARGRHIGRVADAEDSAVLSRDRTGGDRLGAAAGPLSRARKARRGADATGSHDSVSCPGLSGGFMYKSVYVPVDNSDHSNRAVACALALGKAYDAKLVGCHVYAAKLHDYRFRQMEYTLPEE